MLPGQEPRDGDVADDGGGAVVARDEEEDRGAVVGVAGSADQAIEETGELVAVR